MFTDIKELSKDKMFLLLNIKDFNDKGFENVFQNLSKKQKLDFEKFELSQEAKNYRCQRNVKCKGIDFRNLPEHFDNHILNDLVLCYRDNLIWLSVSELFTHEQLRQVFDKDIELQYKEEESRKAAMTEEEKAKEAAIWKKIREDSEPKFYGNMGEPETPEEFKRKYGYDPRGAEYNKEE
ncbi:hypothetical protein C8N26_1976 [Tenacibaculum lutimaris]|uniref:Uncharacterized protein n=2 Tax=Tenacibaculum lutimaris TaxID=285258 RepID=A0A420E0G1_9FLAO|nr:hypothetical protein C8N26_1976 [Tenacibaculum lutimaris]